MNDKLPLPKPPLPKLPLPRIAHRLLLFACLLPSVLVAARAAEGASDVRATASGDVEWMALLLDGQKTGWLRTERRVEDDRVVHEETVHLELTRTGVPIAMTTTDRATETRDGRPLAFLSRQAIAGGTMLIEGSVAADGTTVVTTRSGGSVQTETLTWPEGALLPEGLRLATEAAGLEPGTSFATTAFIASSLQAAPVSVTIVGRERVDLFGVELELVRSEQTMTIGRSETTVTAWVDPDLRPKKMRFSVMGMTLETIACPEECATAAAEPAEFFTQAFERSPVELSEHDRRGVLRYTIQPEDDAEVHFPVGSDQQVTHLDDGRLLVTVGHGRAVPEDAAPARYLGQTRWLQASAPEVIELVHQAGGVAPTPAETMRRLERFVRGYVDDKTLSVGYATALETARSRSGDCTEHALLLAALGRAVGIPTRVATGLAYVGDWLGASGVFVPHAWTQAWIDDRWVSFDAALGSFGAGHLALAYGDGDPWHFYDGVNTLGSFEIVAVEAVAP